MGERNTISSSFTVNTIEDGKDGMVYEIVSSVGSVTIPSDASTATLSATLSFYRRQGTGARETYSCYYAVFRKKGSTYSRIQRSTSKVNSANISFEVTEGNTDAIVACMYDQLATEHSGYLAELEIPVRKNGDTGSPGEDGKDGKDAASLVFEPAVVVLHADSNGNVLVGQSVYSTVTMMLPSGATTTQITLLSEDLYGDAKGSVSGRTIEVWTDEELLDEDAEGYYAVSYSATIGGVTYVANGSLKITVARDGADGPRGNTGPMSYLAGEYDATVNYGALLTDTTCPVVLYTDGYYWYPTEDYRGTGYPPSVANGWKMAYNFEMILTKVLFAQFAKLGGFVVSGDYMLSHYGELIDANGNKLTLTEVTDDNGFRSWQYNGVDAYTYFRDYDPMVEVYRDMNTATYFQYYNSALDYPLLVRNNWQYWSNYETTTDAIYITLNSSDQHINYLKNLAVGGLYYLCGTDTNNVFHRLLMRKTQAVGSNNRLYGTRQAIMEHLSQTMFRPAKVVNAVTGEEWMAGGKVHVTGDGDVTIEGTVKAKNLYHGVCVFIEGGIYSTQWYYVAGTSDWISSKGLSVGDYVEITDAMRAEAYFESTNLLPCTYDADVISMNPNGSANWGSSNDAKTVLLPDPKDFPGKIVEVTSFNYGISAKTAYVGCVVENAFALKVAYNSTSKTVINDTGASVSSITISTGSPIRLLSIYASNQYWWLRIQ